jgi:hypothetical protein
MVRPSKSDPPVFSGLIIKGSLLSEAFTGTGMVIDDQEEVDPSQHRSLNP